MVADCDGKWRHRTDSSAPPTSQGIIAAHQVVLSGQCMRPRPGNAQGSPRQCFSKMWAGTEKQGLPCPEDSASLCSHVLFSWIGPLLREGYRRPLNEGDVFEPPASDHIGVRTEQIRASLAQSASKSEDERDSGTREMLRALLAADGGTFMRIALLRPIWLACVVLQVVSLRFIGTCHAFALLPRCLSDATPQCRTWRTGLGRSFKRSSWPWAWAFSTCCSPFPSITSSTGPRESGSGRGTPCRSPSTERRCA